MINKTIKQYELTKDCFIGNEGDIIAVDWEHHDGASWRNLTQGKMGCPISYDESRALKEIAK